MKKQIGIALASVGLLAMLTGCGFKLDDKTLSADGGVWKVTCDGDESIYQFDSDGKLDMYDEDGKSYETNLSYSVKEVDDNFELMIGNNKITIPNTQDKDSFSGQSEYNVYHFTKEKQDYLDKKE